MPKYYLKRGKMKKISRKTANIITIIAIAIIVTVGVIFTGSIKGWFSESKPEDKSEAIAGLFRESISDIKKSASDAVRETEEKNPDDSQNLISKRHIPQRRNIWVSCISNGEAYQ